MNFVGTFLVFGIDFAPQVHMLDTQMFKYLNQRLDAPLERDAVRKEIYEAIFGMGAQYALPCWSRECMAAIGLDKMKWFKSPHAPEVKRIAACIAIGQPYSLDGGDGDDGNSYDRLPPKKPIKPAPAAASAKAEKQLVLADGSDFVLKDRSRRKK